MEIGNSVAIFAERILDVATVAFPEKNLDNHIITSQLIEVFVDGLADFGTSKEILRLRKEKKIKTLEDAVRIARDDADVQQRMAIRRKEVPMEVDPVHTSAGKGAAAAAAEMTSLSCYYCGKRGHMKRDCRSLTCYSCQGQRHMA